MLDLLSQMKTVDLMLKFLRGDMRRMTPYPFLPQKKPFSEEPGGVPLPHATPENEGVPSKQIERFFQALDRCDEIRVHSVAVLRHGKIIAEGSFRPYSSAYPHMMFSLSKSVTGMAVGMLVKDGMLTLNEKIVDIFSDKGVLLRSPRINNITVLHLLNMTSGIRFNEVGSVVERDWVKAYLQSDCSFEPGTEFSYNSMNSYLLSAIVRKRAGMGLKGYLTPRLFEPLGIPEVTWETCPLGIEKGGWGLYLRVGDMAKLGQLFLQNGRWNVDGTERQLVPEQWVKESTRMQVATREGDHAGGYGYQLWDFNAKGAYQFNGVFGQYVIVLPERDMVIAMTSGSQNLFSDCSSDIVEEYFGDGAPAFSEMPLPNDIPALRSLRVTLENLYAIRETAPKPPEKERFLRSLAGRFFQQEKAEKLSPAAASLNGAKYRFDPNSGSVMPLILQGVTNNFLNGMQEAAFRMEPQACTVLLRDGENEITIEAGLDGVSRMNAFALNGESYKVGATARLARDEDDRPVLKLFLCFVETPCVRTMKCIFYGDKLLIRFDELPSVATASKMLFTLVGGNGNTMEKMLIDTVYQQRLYERMESITLPRAKGALVKTK